MFGRKLLDLLATKRISDSNMLRNVIQLTSVDVWRCNVKESYHTKSHIRKLLNIMNVPHMSAKRLGAHMLISCCRPNFLIFAQTSCRPKRLHTYVCALFLHIDARLIWFDETCKDCCVHSSMSQCLERTVRLMLLTEVLMSYFQSQVWTVSCWNRQRLWVTASLWLFMKHSFHCGSTVHYIYFCSHLAFRF